MLSPAALTSAQKTRPSRCVPRQKINSNLTYTLCVFHFVILGMRASDVSSDELVSRMRLSSLPTLLSATYTFLEDIHQEKCTNIYKHIYMCVYTHTHIYRYIYICIHVYTRQSDGRTDRQRQTDRQTYRQIDRQTEDRQTERDCMCVCVCVCARV